MTSLDSLQFAIKSHIRTCEIRQENAAAKKQDRDSTECDRAYWSGLLNGVEPQAEALNELLKMVDELIQNQQNPLAGDSDLTAIR